MIAPGSKSLVMTQAPALSEIGVLPQIPRRFWQCPIAAPPFREAAVRILSAAQRYNAQPVTAAADLEILSRSRGRCMAHRWYDLAGQPDWLPPHVLQDKFDAATRVALDRSTVYSGCMDWERGMRQSPLELLIASAAQSSWHWGQTRVTWEDLRLLTVFLSRLSIPDRDGNIDPRLTIRLDTTRGSMGSQGVARFTDGLFLDANLALLLYWEGERAATVGFAWTADESGGLPILRVRQIQLCHKKGNRWAFRLGDCYFSAILAALANATRGLARVQVVKGESLARHYAQSYREDRARLLRIRERWDDEDRENFERMRPKAIEYDTVIAPRLAKLYAKVPSGWVAKSQEGNYRELVAA